MRIWSCLVKNLFMVDFLCEVLYKTLHSFPVFPIACLCFLCVLALSVLYFGHCSCPLSFPTCMLTMSPLFGAEQPHTLTQFTSQKGSSWPLYDWSNLSHCGVCLPWQLELHVPPEKEHKRGHKCLVLKEDPQQNVNEAK